jgi:hypothetical protein
VWEGEIAVSMKWETSNAVILTVCGNYVHGLGMTCSTCLFRRFVGSGDLSYHIFGNLVSSELRNA